MQTQAVQAQQLGASYERLTGGDLASASKWFDATYGSAKKTTTALAEHAVAQNAVSSATGNAISGLGRLRYSFGSLAASAAGVSPILGRMTGVLGGFALGNVWTIGILAGIAAIGYAWKKLKSDADELTQAISADFEKMHKKTLDEQLAMGDLQLAAARKAKADAEAALKSASNVHYDAKTGLASGTEGDVGAAKAALDRANADLTLYSAQKSQIEYQIRGEADRNATDSLALLVKSNHATAAERTRAIALYRSDLAEIDRLGRSQTDNVRREALIKEAETLKNALSPKETTRSTDREAGQDRTLANMAALDQQRVASAHALDDAAQISRAEYERTLHTQELEKQILEEQQKILAQHLDTHGQIRAGEEADVVREQQAAAQRIRDIDQTNQHAQTALTLGSQTDKLAMLKAETDAYNTYGGAIKEAAADEEYRQAVVAAGAITDQAQHDQFLANARAIRDQTIALHDAKTAYDARTEAAKKAAEASAQVVKNLVRQMQTEFARFFDTLFTKGITSFRELFDQIKGMFLKLVADLLAAELMKKLVSVWDRLMGKAEPIAVAAQQTAAGATMLSAAQLQVAAANTMLAAAGGTPIATPGGVPSGTAGGASGGGATGAETGTAGTLAAGAGIGIAGGLAGYSVGQSVYSTSHGDAGNYARGALAGAASGALVGAALGSVVPVIGTAIGAVVGGLAGLAGGLFGVGSAAKAAQKQLQGLQDALKLSLEAYRAAITGDTLMSQLLQARDALRQLLLQINAALPGKANETERNKDRADAIALEAELEQKIKAGIAQQNQYAQEDYKVRYLRATGQTKAADDLAFQEAQQREYDKAVADGADAQTLFTLRTTLQAEATARATGALDTFTASLTNAPSGARLFADLDRYLATDAVGRNPFPTSAPPVVPGTDTFGPMVLPTPTTPMYPSRALAPSSASSNASVAPSSVVNEGDTITINISVDGAMLADPQQVADTIGDAIYAKFGVLAQRDAARGGPSLLQLAGRARMGA